MLWRVNWLRVGRLARAIRLRSGLRQQDVGTRAKVSRSAVSLVERGQAARLTIATVEAVLAALGARLDMRVSWNGTELERMIVASHAALSASVKRRLELWGWAVRVEVSYSVYGERGRIDLLAWHPLSRVLLVIEIKIDLVDVQALLGSTDVKARLASRLAERFGWEAAHVVPAIVFLEDRTTRRRLDELAPLFDRYSLRGQPAVSWARRPLAAEHQPSGVIWFRSLPNARVVRISGQRVRIRQPGRSN